MPDRILLGLKIVIIIFIFILVIFWISRNTSTSPFLDNEGKMIKNSIAEEIYLSLGGVEQWVLLRGSNVNNPIFIFLHGGPGISEHALFRYYNNDLENYFLTVGWDQRGCGKSYNKNIPPESMNIDTFVSDLHELIQYLKKRFKRDKVYLLGKSWGSILGTFYAHKYPEDLIAYIGTGQVANVKDSERLSYEFALVEAKKRNNKKALSELSKIKFPPGKDIKDVKIERKWLTKFGGSAYGRDGYIMHWAPKMLSIKEYSWQDIIRFVLGSKISLKFLWSEIFNVNLFEQVLKLNVPVYFLLGRHDHQVSSKLAAEYLEKLNAPKKELIWFDCSGHHPPFEEPERFNEILISLFVGNKNLK
ncbi:alpha/beta hydrolase [Candidatus Babeliales bacterium]|nr:alpha/beta hydrolase [Candidatus Babeliales bacterium]